MRRNYLKNEEICLRAPEPTDLNVMLSIENDSVFWDVSCTLAPWSRYDLHQYIKSNRNDIFKDEQLRLMITRISDEEVVGAVDLTDFNPHHNRAAVGIIILSECQQNGYARQALELLCDYSFNFLHINQLYAHIPVGNEASLRLFASAGFTRSGLLKEWLHRENGYEDVVLVQRGNQREA